jgi:hypothetical protein
MLTLLELLKITAIFLGLIFFFRFIIAKIKSPLHPSSYKNYTNELEKLKH